MRDAIIVGGGLFGQIIARALRADGQDVIVVDNQKPLAGSRPAACLMKPSWFGSMGKDKHEPSLTLLDRLFGVKDIVFKAGASGKGINTTVHWCDPADILGGPFVPATVERVEPGRVFLVDCPDPMEARTVIVAAGIWTNELLKRYGVDMVGQRGPAFLWGAQSIIQPFIEPWAPYRQLVAFDRGDGLWVGDGTAIKAENWTDQRLEQSFERCVRAIDHLDIRAKPRVIQGIRPYAKGHKPCLLKELTKGLWVASGGAKNGTIAAGYCAHVIKEATA